MALRIRKDGRIFCAAINPEKEGDCYIDDDLHYELSVNRKILVTTENSHHMSTGGEWWWKGQVPENIVIDSLNDELEEDDTVTCYCSGNELGTHSEEVMVPIPNHMLDYEEARVVEGLSRFICIDYCILPEIKYLWSLGIVTYGCCCGHNKIQSMVNVDEKDIEKMLELGYVQNHVDKTRKDTFRLKSAG